MVMLVVKIITKITLKPSSAIIEKFKLIPIKAIAKPKIIVDAYFKPCLHSSFMAYMFVTKIPITIQIATAPSGIKKLIEYAIINTKKVNKNPL
jgi:hypothetical protein